MGLLGHLLGHLLGQKHDFDILGLTPYIFGFCRELAVFVRELTR